jgi:hypothetical protein
MQKVLDSLVKLMGEAFEKKQQLPHQYVVAYYRTKDDSLIGYHSSTSNTHKQEILEAKRYSGDNPYEQIQIIANNLKFTFKAKRGSNWLEDILVKNREHYYAGLSIDDIYLDAVYLAKGTPTQKFRYQILK